MTLNEKDRDQLIGYRLQQSQDCIDEVAFLIRNKKYKTAINRIYYGMFYALLALGLKYGFETSKHSQLLGWFNNKFIRTGRIDINMGKIINKSYSLRQESDYEPFITYEEQQVNLLYSKMKDFIDAVGQLIREDD